MAETKERKRNLRKRCRASSREQSPLRKWPGEFEVHVEKRAEAPSKEPDYRALLLGAILLLIVAYAMGADDGSLLKVVFGMAFVALFFPSAKNLLGWLLEK